MLGMFKLFSKRNIQAITRTTPAFGSLTQSELSINFPKNIDQEALASLEEEGRKFMARAFPNKVSEQDKIKALVKQYPKKISSEQLKEGLENAAIIKREFSVY